MKMLFLEIFWQSASFLDAAALIFKLWSTLDIVLLASINKYQISMRQYE